LEEAAAAATALAARSGSEVDKAATVVVAAPAAHSSNEAIAAAAAPMAHSSRQARYQRDAEARASAIGEEAINEEASTSTSTAPPRCASQEASTS
jgi:hypothetical protein